MALTADTCPLCGEHVPHDLGDHLRRVHGEEAWRQAVLAAKKQGWSDAAIGARYGVSFHQLQRIITAAYGANVSLLDRPKRIRRWQPAHFRPETTTVWSFKQRGNWATHDGRYRGNWSPYIPRNVILRYSRPGDTVLDYFVGGGTTAVEAKLLGRRCIARDINPEAVRITEENLRFTPPPTLLEASGPIYEPAVTVGDARDLGGIPDGSMDLICAHPPYAGIIQYGTHAAGDLSALSGPEFLTEMGRVARESLRVLKPGGKCAILIGDARRSKHVVPIGFQTIRVFLEAGFILRELVIKRQHNCKTTGFWYTRSIKYNFLLLAHEYLPIFEKPLADQRAEPVPCRENAYPYEARVVPVPPTEEDETETTTVWIFPPDRMAEAVRRNLVRRFAAPGGPLVEIEVGNEPQRPTCEFPAASVIHVTSANALTDDPAIARYRATVREIARRAGQTLPDGGFLVIEAPDVRLGETLRPVGWLIWADLSSQPGFDLKEIVIVAPDAARGNDDRHLAITHRYLLIYTRSGQERSG